MNFQANPIPLHALQMYFDSVKNQPWYANTVFILTSDHGSTHSGYAGMDDHNRFRIPFIIFNPGNTLKRENEAVHTSFNHYDIPYTLAFANGFDAGKFIFGRNILCADSTRYAYWNTDHVAACYSLQNGEVVLTTQKNNRATLFTDLVRRWFNNLSN